MGDHNHGVSHGQNMILGHNHDNLKKMEARKFKEHHDDFWLLDHLIESAQWPDQLPHPPFN